MPEEMKYVYSIGATALLWIGRLIWVNHKSVEQLRRESPSWDEMKKEIAGCSQQKDKEMRDMKTEMRDNFKYIRDKVDQINNREINK